MSDTPIKGVGGSQTSPLLKRPVGSVPPARGIDNETQTQAGSRATSPVAASGTHNSSRENLSGFAQLEKLLPVEILKDPLLTRAEWAWRRLLAEYVQADGTGPGKTVTTRLANGLQTLWRILAQSGSKGDDALGSFHLPQSQANTSPFVQVGDGGSLLVFDQVRDMHSILMKNPRIRAGVLADRLVGSTRDADSPIAGAGFYVPPQAGTNSEASVAVPFKAKRWTRMAAANGIVHRLVLHVEYEHSPVDIFLVCAKPSLYAHIATSNFGLRQRLNRMSPILGRTLKPHGWRLDGWSVGELEGNP